MSDMFQRLSKQQLTQQPQMQNPKEQALNLLKQQGFNIPEGKENDPNYLINYVMQSGKYPQNRLTMAQQIMGRMFRR